MLILSITAETWEIGLRQSASVLAGLVVAIIALTTLYIVTRQRLFVRRERQRLSELSVVTNVSTWAIVLCGMAISYVLLALFTFLFGQLFFPPTLVADWTGLAALSEPFWAYVKLALFVASIGMFVGALGATFEDNYYFRHITFVDEEI
jgi:hypothetical protein